MNTQNKRKILGRIALALLLVSILALALTGCGSNTAINTKVPEGGWADTKVDLAPSEGFLDKLLSYIGVFLGWITAIMPAKSYILTLFVFAILLEVLMLPFAIKQQKNSIKQARLRPKEMAIRKKYAGRNDQATQQKVTQEIQELYQKENFNPMSGCLQLLLQFPIIIVLYWLVVDPIQYVCGGSKELISVLYSFITSPVADGGLGMKLASTNGSIEIFSKIKELGPEAFEGIKSFCANGAEVFADIQRINEVPANFFIGGANGINLGLTPSFDLFSSVNGWLLLLPVLTFVIYFFSMKINRKLQFQPTQSADDRQQACSNNMMDITMPLMSVWMTFIVPAAVGVYWIFKSILGVVKQFIMSKAMPLPTFTEEDYKEAEKEILGKQQPKKIVKSANAGKVRSLHHIDDEDYDEKGNYRPVQPEPEKEEVAEEKIADNKMTEGASLKDETDKAEKTEKKSRLFGKKDKKD
ncbi:MAG: membrane protein insertase YidC [Clostridia bacterium]|nr:membrane protein insertase YidC [Clostridia bacterium]